MTHTSAELADWYGHKAVLRLLEEKPEASVSVGGEDAGPGHAPSTATHSTPTDGLAQLAIASTASGVA